ncbi:MAG: hypothetical protein FWG67_00980, partial [Defluviitaleaceae bacterium]|nr:hypothetical protein [Defluviitaleaceae bacterium]
MVISLEERYEQILEQAHKMLARGESIEIKAQRMDWVRAKNATHDTTEPFNLKHAILKLIIDEEKEAL